VYPTQADVPPSGGALTPPLDYSVQVIVPKTVFTAREELKSGDPYYPLRGNCYHKVITVELQAGNSYQIDLVAAFHPYLYLEDALGNILKVSQYSGNAQLARIYFNPGKTDSYRLIATTNNQNDTGGFNVTVTDAPIQVAPGGGFGKPINPGFGGGFKGGKGGIGGIGGGVILPAPNPKVNPKPKVKKGQPNLPVPPMPNDPAPADGRFVPAQAALPGQPAPQPGPAAGGKDDKKDEPKVAKKGDEGELNFKGELKVDAHPFKMTAGQIYAVKVKAKNFQPMVQIRNAQNNQLYMTKNGGALNYTTKEYNLAFSYNPAANGTYNIQIVNMGDVLAAGPLDYAIDVSPLKLLLSKTEQLTNQDALYAKRPNCYHKIYNVTMKAGVTYQIDLTGPFNPFLYLENAAGGVLMTNFNGGGANHARMVYTPNQDGEYKVIVTTLTNNATGQFSLTVSDAPLGMGGIGGPVFPGDPLPPFKGGFGGGVQIMPAPGGLPPAVEIFPAPGNVDVPLLPPGKGGLKKN